MAGKGSKPRPRSVDQKTFDENWDKIFRKKNPTDLWAFPKEETDHSGMWQHSCTVEMGVMWIGKDETCNYCGAWEEDDE